MKGLDTPVLLGILHGAPSVRALLSTLSGEELATTELNMIELAAIGAQGGARARRERLQALERLRRRVTVLPIDRRAADQLTQNAPAARSAADLQLHAMLAAFEAAGCSHVLAEGKTPLLRGPRRVKITNVSIK